MRIFSLICQNGLGHYKRTIAVLYKLKEILPTCNIMVACEHWQIERMHDWETSSLFWKMEGVNQIDKIIDPGVKWEKDQNKYDDGSILSWHTKLENNLALKDADLVLSDNLAQVLYYRNDGVLMGSFLWSDILDNAYGKHPVISAFVKEEKFLLQKNHPPMICVGDMVMEGVKQQTNAIKMPWFCTTKNTPEKSHQEKIHIALLSGATESITHILPDLALSLADSNKYIVYLPSFLHEQLGNHPAIRIFDFSSKSFNQLDVIVCRPGMGTVTDCVAYGIPVVALPEQGNLEMYHNSKRIEELGIGLNLSDVFDISEIKERVSAFMQSGKFRSASRNIKMREKNGIEASARWLVDNYN